MAKLKDDEIRWILTVDAKGAQAELQKYTSDTVRLSKENKILKAEIKGVETQIASTEKEMRKLEKSNSTNTEAYKELQNSLESAKSDLADYNKKISENFTQIQANDTAKKQIIETMSIEDMTMNQLKNRAKELQLQLNHTAESTSPEAYAELQSAIKVVQNRMEALKNSNQATATSLLETMSVQELTMNQLKDIARELEQQLNNTAESTSPEAYAELQAQLQRVYERMDELNEVNRKLSASFLETMKVEEMTMNQLQYVARDLQQQLNDTSKAADPKAYAELQKELESVNGRISELNIVNRSLSKTFSSIPGPIGSTIRSVQGLGTALKALIANPVGIIIMTIVAAFLALKTAITGSQEASAKLDGVLQALSSVFNSLKRIISEVVAAFINLSSLDFGALKQNAKNIKEISSNLLSNASAANDAALAEMELNKQIDRNNDITQVNKARIQELRQIVEDTTKSFAERKVASAELLRLERDNYKMAVSAISGQYEVWKGKNGDLIDAMKRGNADQFAEVEKYMQLVEEGTELTFQQRVELANLVNDITSSLDSSTQEQREEFRSFFSDISSMQEDFFAKSRLDQRKSTRLAEDARREATQNAKKAIEKQIQNSEDALSKEINLLKDKRLQGLMTEKEYAEKVDQLTISSYQKRLEIKGLEEKKIVSFNQQILDLQLKQQDRMDSQMLEMIRKKQKEQLQLLDVARNTQLEILQEEETDQSLYKLRAAEIESHTAEARLAVIRQFGESLKQIDFSNEQTRLDAIRESEEEILSAESETLKKREIQQRQFTRITMDFERQYNVKSWEQRRDQELEILKKQNEAKLLDEETYQAAVNEIEKKYADEKFNIRQQYGITKMSEEYDTELELLKEHHEKGILSEEDFEKAKLELKLKYAQEYASQVSQILSAASGTVSALMDAETANVERRYDAEIQAAGDNSEEVERLEKEKAQKKLDIEKKYADVQFAVTAAEIISNTSLAIMQSFAQLGPIAGAVAAALMGVTGAAQLAVANEQRLKVKQMTLSGSSSSATPQTGTISLNEGFAQGGANMEDSDREFTSGYTGEGGRYEVAGWVPLHRGEYVVAVPELKQPDVAEKVRAIERVRRKRTSENPLPEGFAQGGANMSSTETSSQTVEQNQKINNQLLQLLSGLVSGRLQLRTNYGVTEYQAAEKEKQKAESNFTL